MMAHAERLEFEQAAELRNQVSALSQRAAPAVGGQVTSAEPGRRHLGGKGAGGRACVNLAMVRGGRHLGDRPYFPVHVEEALGVCRRLGRRRRSRPHPLPAWSQQILEAFLAQHYLSQPIPASLIVSDPIAPEAGQGPVQAGGLPGVRRPPAA